jgi:hypothetical protein
MRLPRIVAPVAVLVLTLGACGSDDESETVTETDTETVVETSASTPPATTAPQPAGPAAVSLDFFSTPSGNVACAMTDQNVRCDIAEKDWTPPPKPDTCPVDWGNGLNLEGVLPGAPVCAGDTVLGEHPVLEYGQASEVGPYRCESEQAGVTCRHLDAGTGFFLARERYEVF